MRETEVKILGIDRDSIVSRLSVLGARKTFDGEMHAVYYDTPERLLRGRRITLRLRKEGSSAVLALKHDIDDAHAKVREEKEVTVSDFTTAQAIIEALGYSAWLSMRKHRTTFELDGLHFELDRYHDDYSFIPEFLEIEGPSAEMIHRYAGLLGYSGDDCRPWDVLQVAAHYSGLHRSAP